MAVGHRAAAYDARVPGRSLTGAVTAAIAHLSGDGVKYYPAPDFVVGVGFVESALEAKSVLEHDRAKGMWRLRPSRSDRELPWV
jgi:hypothetical protein